MAKQQCTSCKKETSFLKKVTFMDVAGKDYCQRCGERQIEEMISRISLTTTNNIDGWKVHRYIGIESVEIVIGTGMFSEFAGDISDFFGMRSTAFEVKLQKAKQTAFKSLKYRAATMGGNAVIGIDLDYTEFSGNRIGLIANGTVVEVRPEDEQ